MKVKEWPEGPMNFDLLFTLSHKNAGWVEADTSDEKLRLARDVGAEEAVMPGKGAAEAINEATAGRGAELAIDMVGGDDKLTFSAQIVCFESHLTVVGLAGGSFQFGFSATRPTSLPSSSTTTPSAKSNDLPTMDRR